MEEDYTPSRSAFTFKMLEDDLTATIGSDDDELRATDDGKSLYTKKDADSSLISSPASRARRRNNAIILIETALINQLGSAMLVPGHYLLGVVRRLAGSAFKAVGPLTRGDFYAIADATAKVEKTLRAYCKKCQALETTPWGSKSTADCDNYQIGIRNHKTLLPGIEKFNEALDYFEAVQLFCELSSAQPLAPDHRCQQLGALEVFIRRKAGTLLRGRIEENGAAFKKLASDHEAVSMGLFAQINFTRLQRKTNIVGLCMPLSALAAYAESTSRSSLDALLKRLDQEIEKATKSEFAETTAYAKGLFTLWGNSHLYWPIANGTKPSGHLSVAALLNKQQKTLGNDRCLIYLTATPNHAMIMGLTRHGGQMLFIFFDPNIGFVRFKTSSQLSEFMSDYFKLDPCDRYCLGGPQKDGYRFTTVVPFDLQPTGEPEFTECASLFATMIKPEAETTSASPTTTTASTPNPTSSGTSNTTARTSSSATGTTTTSTASASTASHPSTPPRSPGKK